MLQLQAVPALRDNYIWLLADSQRLVIVDPGEAEPVLAALHSLGRLPTAILVTHHHPDHIGGIDELLRHWPQLPVYAPFDERIPQASVRVADGDRVAAGLPFAFDVLEVPGHTRSHVAYFGKPDAEAPVLFCGDTLFSLGCGRLFEGTPAQMHASLQRLAQLPGNTRVCCAHEYTEANLRFARSLWPQAPMWPSFAQALQSRRQAGLPSLPSSIEQERRLNPFLSPQRPPWGQAIAEALDLTPGVDEVQAFAAVRRAKDQFA